jgi:radical SAM protein with 4Fe4S-binding SPASM domain
MEAMKLLNTVRRFGRIVVVLSGGDPAQRPDLVDLVTHAARLGLRVALTPATTARVTPALLRRLKSAGLARIAVSLDGPTPEIHDAFRGVDGSYREALRILKDAQAEGLSTQVNTVFSNHNLADFDRLGVLMSELGIVFWEVFFLVPIGRARPQDTPSADEFEAMFHRMFELSETASFDIKATAAPHYARVVLQRQVNQRQQGQRAEPPNPLTAGLYHSMTDGIRRARGVTEGDGYVFISHKGEIFPSGFLPISAGNVRTDDLVEVYRHAPLFRWLRDRSLLKGKCGVCEYREICGGCRARAYALTGDCFGADESCAFTPAGYVVT